jgi:dihydrofolate reductase
MRLVLTSFITLDGVVQGPGGPDEDEEGGFDLGGWLVPFFVERGGDQVTEWFADADAFLLGRRTYEIFAGYWPNVTDADDPVASKLNALPKYVASRTLSDVSWSGAELVRGDLTSAVEELKGREGRTLQIHGSASMAQTLIEHGLIDQYRLMTAPVVLGKGKRLFRDGARPVALVREHLGVTSTGVSLDTYAPSGDPSFGRFGPEDQG